jgi:hypothetical protein
LTFIIFSGFSESLQQHCRRVSQSMFYRWFFPTYHWLLIQSYYYHRLQNLGMIHSLSNWNPQKHTQMMRMKRTYCECTICLKELSQFLDRQIQIASNWNLFDAHDVFCEGTCLISEQVFYLLKRNFRNQYTEFPSNHYQHQACALTHTHNLILGIWSKSSSYFRMRCIIFWLVPHSAY